METGRLMPLIFPNILKLVPERFISWNSVSKKNMLFMIVQGFRKQKKMLKRITVIPGILIMILICPKMKKSVNKDIGTTKSTDGETMFTIGKRGIIHVILPIITKTELSQQTSSVLI